MPANEDAESRRRAVLAAVLAVKRGFLSPDDAMNMLDGVIEAAPDAPNPAPDALGTVLAIGPSADAGALTAELDAMMQKGGSALEGLGLSSEQQQSLLSLRPGASDDKTRVHGALSEVARGRLESLRAQLPVSGAGRYDIKREFARGGMGRILVAVDTAVGREVALKEVLGPRGGSSGARSEPNALAIERFVREAKVTGQLEHPNIVPVYEICRREDGSIFYTMKLVRGRSLAEKLAEIRDSGRPDADKRALRLQLIESFLDVCHAIAYAHSRGVIHRDLKPQNIMLGNFGETVVLDWGLARVGDESPVEQAKVSPSLRDGRDSHTVDGTVIGTPAYMPPEQARGQLEFVDEKSDVYSLGAILYELLAGRPPFEGMGADSILEKVINSRPEPLAQASPGAPPDLVRLCERAMERERSQRLASASALAKELQAFRDGRNLSVYDYSSLELVRRFVSRNRAPVSVMAIALLALVTVISISVYNVAQERDNARDALARADAEQSQRIALENAQRRERDKLVQQRRQAIGAATARLADLNPAEVAAEARAVLAELLALTPEQRRYKGPSSAAQRASSRLLQVAGARRELYRLVTEPVAGIQEDFLPANEAASLAGLMLEDRMLAALLAQKNDDFALAQAILDETDGPQDRLAQAREELHQASFALRKQRGERVQDVLEAIRAGKDRNGASVNAEQVRVYIAEIGPWRDMYTTQLVRQALEQLLVKVAGLDGGMLDVRKRLELEFATEVMLLATPAAEAVPVLAQLMLALSDEEIVVDLAATLCRMGHESAFLPLVQLLGKYGTDSLIWQRVRRYVSHVPAPADLPPPLTAREAVDRASILADQERFAEALAMADLALKLSPGLERARLVRVRAVYDSKGQNSGEMQVVELDAILKDLPDCARALSGRARMIHVGKPIDDGYEQRSRDALAMLDRAVALAPDDWLVRVHRASNRLRGLAWNDTVPVDDAGALADLDHAVKVAPRIPEVYRVRAAALSSLGRRLDAMADVNHALDLDPDHVGLWMMRAGLHSQAENWQAAVRDYTRAIELAPENIFVLVSRATARMNMGDHQGALDDLATVHAIEGDRFPPLFHARADVRKAMGDKAGAIADLEHYLKLRPNFPDGDEVRKEIRELKGEQE